MGATILADPTQAMAEHLRHLKTYASRVIVQRESLRPEEEIDRESRVGEFLAMGKSVSCTEKELVTLLYAGVFQGRKVCDCAICRAWDETLARPEP